MEDNNVELDRSKQTLEDIVLTAYNRNQRRKLTKLKIPFKTHSIENRVNKNKSEFKQSKREIALTHGSKTGKLKKKHLNRELRFEGLRR